MKVVKKSRGGGDFGVEGLVGAHGEGFDGRFPGLGGNDVSGGVERKGVVLLPGSAEEWIARQGHEGVLLC